MASVTKDLSALNSVMELDCQRAGNLSRGSFHYIQGTGTIELECTLQVSDDAHWIALVDDTGTPIAGISAVGLTTFPIAGYARIRARNSVAGAGNLSALGFS